jgi:VIT1/CCC1 family predicted Fe2+/Mn2+ transporter
MDKWLSTYKKLVILELALCVVFFVIGHISGNAYFRGVGVGLLIAWVTGALAYFIVKRRV